MNNYSIYIITIRQKLKEIEDLATKRDYDGAGVIFQSMRADSINLSRALTYAKYKTDGDKS